MHNRLIDLRSDTVTRPSPGMRRAMMEAEVGDLQYGDDPSINRLQERIADVTGKEAALWFPTGTQANQVALLLHTRPGDDVVAGQESHVAWHEAGGGAANAGIQFSVIGVHGLFTADAFVGALKPRVTDIYSPTTLVVIENTHNRMGGLIWPQDEVIRVCNIARKHGVATHLDGARLWNAAAETGRTIADLAAPFDTVMVAMSKGLGAPGGSLLAGPRELMDKAVRYRRRLGGAMRQAGFFAAAGEYGLDHNFSRLKQDHEAARMLGRMLSASPRVQPVAGEVATNILIFDLAEGAPDAATVVRRARERGVLVSAFGPRRIRMVTHLDVSHEDCRKAAEILEEIIR